MDSILAGAQAGVFVRHYDVATLHETAQRLRVRKTSFPPERPVPASGIQRAIERVAKSPVISIAAINGKAMGGGYEIAMACDIRWLPMERTVSGCQRSMPA